jgi:hypothetical protein
MQRWQSVGPSLSIKQEKKTPYVYYSVFEWNNILTKHINKAESYYRLSPYCAESTVLCIYVS